MHLDRFVKVMDEQLEIPQELSGRWYVCSVDFDLNYLHNDGVVKMSMSCTVPISTGWFDTKDAAWAARNAYYKAHKLIDTVGFGIYIKGQQPVCSVPLFDD